MINKKMGGNGAWGGTGSAVEVGVNGPSSGRRGRGGRERAASPPQRPNFSSSLLADEFLKH